MGLFSSKKCPVILKETSNTKQQICELEELLLTASEDIKPKIEQDIKLLTYGMFGEEQVLFELKNSHIPMYVLYDLYLEDEGSTAQIDFLVITRKITFVIECKNLIGNIEINNHGDFIRTINYGKTYKKEGIYSPITQNRRHLELIKQIQGRTKPNFLIKALFDRYFYSFYQGVVVLANPKTVLNDKYAKKDIKEQVIRVDRLVEHIRQVNASSKEEPSSDKQMANLAEFFLSLHKENPMDYLAKYKNATPVACGAEELAGEKTPDITTEAAPDTATKIALETTPEIATKITPVTSKTENADSVPICQECNTPMILRTATRGERAGKKFWGCSNYPKCRNVVNVEETE